MMELGRRLHYQLLFRKINLHSLRQGAKRMSFMSLRFGQSGSKYVLAQKPFELAQNVFGLAGLITVLL